MDAVLETNDQSKKIALRNISLYKDGSGGSCIIEVSSGSLSFSMSFSFDYPSLEEFTDGISKICSALSGEIKLGQQFEEPYIMFKAIGSGHIIVSGFLAVYSDCTQKVEFAFETDQTVLPSFIKQLKNACSENAT